MANPIERFRDSEPERLRTADLLGLLPKGRRSVLDVGAKDGHFSRLLRERFAEVTALDLVKPEFEIEGVITVAGDATQLGLPTGSFDCVFCTEVLEHIPNLRAAARELTRVARHELVIGVPFEEDTRVGRTTCRHCGKASPPWGHLHTFTERQLLGLFPGLRVNAKSYVDTDTRRTNPVSRFLMDRAGNPWGEYGPDQRCTHCGATLVSPPKRAWWQRACSAAAVRIVNRIQPVARPNPKWIHVVLSKDT